jgi:hypothetical protein
MSSSEDTDPDDGSIFVATQTEREIRDSIKEKYGDLPKDTFKERIVQDVPYADIIEIRKSLYDLAVLSVPDTPRGTLAIRKDRTGGAPAVDKLAEDVYLLTHYLHGDTSMDLMKCLSEKSKKKLQRKRQPSMNVLRDDSTGSTSQQVSQNTTTVIDERDERDLSVREFCVSVLAEMRKDRDVLLQEITALRGNSILLKKVCDDVRDIRQELAHTRDRVTKLEVLASDGENDDGHNGVHTTDNRCKQIQKAVTRLQKRTNRVELSVESMTSLGIDVKNQVASNNASLTKRINQLELVIRSPGKHPMASAPSQHLSPVQPSGSKQQSSPIASTVVHQTVDQRNSNKSQSYAKGDTFAVIENNYQRVVNLSADKSSRFTVTLGKESTDQVGIGSPENSKRSGHKQNGGLQGYIPVERRPHYKVFFVSGILRNGGDVDETIVKVQGYMESNGCNIKSIRHVKHSHRTLSVKVVVFEESAQLLAASMFWPEGIQCRPWQD